MKFPFVVKQSKIHGYGIFASRDIKSGKIICLMDGEIIDIPEIKRMYETGEEKESYPLQISQNEYLDLKEPYVFINHSCNSNCFIRRKNELVAKRDIKSGEEITYDYSLTEWTDDSKWGDDYEDSWTMKCKCGSKDCREIVTEFDFLPKEIQKRVIELGLVQDFIKSKAEKENLIKN